MTTAQSTTPSPSTRKSVTLPDDMWEEIKEFQHSNWIATGAEAVRRLLQAALDAERRKVARRG